MKKYFWIILSIFVAFLIFIIVTYIQSITPFKNEKKEAFKLALLKTEMERTESFQLYNGTESVYVVRGYNGRGERIIVWIPEDTSKIVVRKETDGISEKDAIRKIEVNNLQKIIDVRLGMEKGIPLWEIYYQTDKNLINYYYVDFKTGEWLKKIENL